MDLSVVIVNYNVKHFLEQCLHSVMKSSTGLEVEIFVVDNNSVDGSAQLIKEKFPDIHFIENHANVGFSKANNQAIALSRGRYVLLLNPDTIVEEDTFNKIVQFMDKHPDAGALGVKMIDGKGNFLPESKRGLPTPWVAFYKMFGISRLFPKSKKFGKYHLSYLDDNKTHVVDVLAGAFMLLRKTVLDKTGFLDETFFMYGEDIDLSYRITQAGYKNYYYPETTIVHYKGESTKKGSLNYVKVFYNAMIIFARKHFSGGKASLFSLLIHLAIYFRAFLSLIRQFIQKTIIPVVDMGIIYLGYLLFVPFWENLKYHSGYYPSVFTKVIVPAYILVWIMGILLSGGYKKPISLYKVVRGLAWGTLAILLIYSMVDEDYRFSRALILMGFVWSVILLPGYRIILHLLNIKGFGLHLDRQKKIAIAGHSPEAMRVKELLENTEIRSELAGFIALDNTDKGEYYIGDLDQMEEIIRINKVNEVIFCANNLSSAHIIRAMLDLSHLDIEYKIAPPDSISIIGSSSIHTAGELYVLNLNTINKAVNRRKKRIFDVLIALMVLLGSPLLLFFFRNNKKFMQNTWKVFCGKKSWTGYIPLKGTFENLPEIKPGILNPGDILESRQMDTEKIKQLNMIYAKDYSLLLDMEIMSKAFFKIDR